MLESPMVGFIDSGGARIRKELRAGRLSNQFFRNSAASGVIRRYRPHGAGGGGAVYSPP